MCAQPNLQPVVCSYIQFHRFRCTKRKPQNKYIYTYIYVCVCLYDTEEINYLNWRFCLCVEELVWTDNLLLFVLNDWRQKSVGVSLILVHRLDRCLTEYLDILYLKHLLVQ